MKKGTEEQFDLIVSHLRTNADNYEKKKIKFISYVDQLDVVFANYGWDREAFNSELNERLGIENNDSRAAKRTLAANAVKTKSRKTKSRQ